MVFGRQRQRNCIAFSWCAMTHLRGRGFLQVLVKNTEDCFETPGRGPRSRADPSSLCSFSQVIDEVEIAASLMHPTLWTHSGFDVASRKLTLTAIGSGALPLVCERWRCDSSGSHVCNWPWGLPELLLMAPHAVRGDSRNLLSYRRHTDALPKFVSTPGRG